MKLSAWVKAGNPMLSNYTTAWACKTLNCREKDLRNMELEDIYRIPGAGEVAKREHLRWKQFNIIEEAIDNEKRPV